MALTNGGSFTDKVNFIWSAADLLRVPQASPASRGTVGRAVGRTET